MVLRICITISILSLPLLLKVSLWSLMKTFTDLDPLGHDLRAAVVACKDDNIV
jgi:hypothetical protein